MGDFVMVNWQHVYDVGLCGFAVLMGFNVIADLRVWRRMREMDDRLDELLTEAVECADCRVRMAREARDG